MAIANYTDLQAAIADYLARADLTARIPDFITQCESVLNRAIRTRDMETSSSVVMTAGSGAVPTDFLEWVSAVWVGVRTADLRYVEPDSEEWRIRYRPNGDPTMFTIMASTLKIRPILTGNVTLFYYKAIPALASNTTNWLLTRSPDLYVSGSLAQAYRFTKDEARMQEALQTMKENAQLLVQDADSNKMSRRPNRLGDLGAYAIARTPQMGGPV